METDEADLSMYLGDKGTVPTIGAEKGRTVLDGISKYVSPHGSVRYVLRQHGIPVGVLQAVVTSPGKAKVANVYVAKESRRTGIASLLMQRARKEYTVEHSEHQTQVGAKWAKENPAKGRDWAKRVYEEKLQTGSFANIGKQFPDDVKAARSVQSIALKKLYVKDARSSRKVEAPLPRWDRAFWADVLAWANEQEALLNYPEEWQKAQAHIERFLKAGELDEIDLEFLQTKYHVVQSVLDRMRGDGLVKKVKGVYYPVKDNPTRRPFKNTSKKAHYKNNPRGEWAESDLELVDFMGQRALCSPEDPRCDHDGMKLVPVRDMPGWFGAFVGDADEWLPILVNDGYCDDDAWVYDIDFAAANDDEPRFFWYPDDPDPEVWNKGDTPSSILVVTRVDSIPAKYVKLVEKVPFNEIPNPEAEGDEYEDNPTLSLRDNPVLEGLRFLTSCIGWSGRSPSGDAGHDIQELKSTGKPVSRKAFLSHVDREDMRDIEESLSYAKHPSQGLTMAGDRHVGYFRGRFCGKPVYYFVHSGIEHIFMDPDDASNLEVKDNPTLSPRDKKVIDAFVARKKASSPTLDSDGRRLHRSVGNEDVARWMGDRIVETSTESTRHDQTILRYLRKKAKTVSGYGQPTYAKGLRFFEGGDAIYQGQWDGYIVAYVPQREAPVGRLDYSEYGGRYSIKMVEVDPAYRRYGVSTALFEHLLREHKITQADIDRGMQTEDGHQFRKAVDSYLPNPITRKLKASKQDVPAPLKAVADGLLQWRGVEALGGKDVLAWVRRDGTPAFAFQGPALLIETRALNEEHMPINNRGSQADLNLQRSVGLDAKLESGRGWTGVQGGAGQTMSSDMVSLDEAADSIPDVLTAALGWKVNRPHFTMMPLEGEPYEGTPTPYYSAKRKKVFEGQAPGNIIKVEVFEDGKDVQKVGVDFCTVADRISETEGGVVGTLSGEDRFFLSHAFSVEGEQVDAKASAKLIKECGGLLYPSLALSDVPANNFGLCTLFFHLGLMVKHIKPYKKPSRGAWQVITYDTDAWTERTRNFAGDASAELYAQLTGQWEPRTYGHMMVLGPEAVEGTASMGHDVKQVKTVANLRTALKLKRARWKRGMTEEQIDQASDTSSLRYPYLEVKINGILDLGSVPLATCPDFQKKAAVTFLKAIGFRGELIVVKVPEDMVWRLTTYVGGKAEAKALWDYAWLVRDAVTAWQEKKDTKVKKWNEMWLEHVTDGGELSRPKL